jgi:HEAT repeat protein
MVALGDPNPGTRGAAAEALRMLGDRRALPALQEAWRVARSEEKDDAGDVNDAGDANTREALQWLLDEVEEAIAALSGGVPRSSAAGSDEGV